MATSDDYEVGYGKPPKHTRFRKGRSGNPAGRPKRSRNLRTDLEEELNAQITVREGGREKRIRKQQALVKRHVNKAVEGDLRALHGVLDLIGRVTGYGEPEVEQEHLSAEEQALIDSLRTRFADLMAGNNRRSKRKESFHDKPHHDKPKPKAPKAKTRKARSGIRRARRSP